MRWAQSVPPRSLIAVGQITLTSSSKAAGTRRFTSGSWGCELGEELLPAFSLAFRRYQGAQGGALVVQLLVPVFVGLGVYQQLGEPSRIADGKVAGVVGAEDADRAGNAGAEDGDPGGQGLGDRVSAALVPGCEQHQPATGQQPQSLRSRELAHPAVARVVAVLSRGAFSQLTVDDRAGVADPDPRAGGQQPIS